VPWGQPGCTIFMRWGTAVDVTPGSQLEAAIGASNLSAVIPANDPRRAESGGGGTFSKDGLAN
jgi:hypothetical protein